MTRTVTPIQDTRGCLGCPLIFAVLLAVITCVVPQAARGQNDSDLYSIAWRGVPLEEALANLVNLTGIDLAFNARLDTDWTVFCTSKNKRPEELLRCVLSGSTIDYARSSTGTFILFDSIEAPTRFGSLGGRVVDGVTGRPLPYANVLLSTTAAGTVTDETGLFTFSSLVSGAHEIVVTYVGYETVVDSVEIGWGGASRTEISLQPTRYAMPPTVINGLEQRLPSSGLGGGDLASSELIRRASAGTPDIARSTSRVSGISIQRPIADLHIQGGAAGDHLTLLDGAPVRDPVSLGRYLGAFSPLALRSLTVHKTGFDARFGSHLSGLVSVEHDIHGFGQHIDAHIDPVSINAAIRESFEVQNGARVSAMAAARISLWSVVHDPGVNDLLQRWNRIDPLTASGWLQEEVTQASLGPEIHEPETSFSDFHGGLHVRLNPFEAVSATAYRATNRIQTDAASVNRLPESSSHLVFLTRDGYDWTNWAGQARYERLLRARAVISLQALGSLHESLYAYGGVRTPSDPIETQGELLSIAAVKKPELDNAQGSHERNRIREAGVVANVTTSITPNRHLEAGFRAIHTDASTDLGNPFISPLSHSVAGWELTTHLHGTQSLGLRTTLEPGIRITYLSLRQTVYAEPRFAVRYDRSYTALGGLALRLAGGLYRQYTNTFELTSTGATSVVPHILFWLPVDRTVAPARAYHVAGDMLLLPSALWSVGLELYRKWQPRLLVLDYARLVSAPGRSTGSELVGVDQNTFVVATDGSAYGAGLRLLRRGPRLELGSSYEYSFARLTYPGRFHNRAVEAPWNQPHLVTLSGSVKFGGGLSLDLDWMGVWRQKWAYRRSYYDYLALAREIPAIDIHSPNDHRKKPYMRLDLGLGYDLRWGRTALQGRVLVANVLDRDNVYDLGLEGASASAGSAERLLPGRHLAVSVRMTL